MMGFNEWNNLGRRIDTLRTNYTPEQWRMLGGDDMPRFANIREPLYQPTRSWWIIPACVLLGMALAGWAVSADPIGRLTYDLVNPQLEGF